MRARSRFGIAIAAMIRMIATTMSNSINEKPFCFRVFFTMSPLTGEFLTPDSRLVAICLPSPTAIGTPTHHSDAQGLPHLGKNETTFRVGTSPERDSKQQSL